MSYYSDEYDDYYDDEEDDDFLDECYTDPFEVEYEAGHSEGYLQGRSNERMLVTTSSFHMLEALRAFRDNKGQTAVDTLLKEFNNVQ